MECPKCGGEMIQKQSNDKNLNGRQKPNIWQCKVCRFYKLLYPKLYNEEISK